MPANERALFASPISSAAGRVIASPFQFYTTGEEALRISSVNSVVGVRVNLHGRFLDSNGVITAARWEHVPNTNRTRALENVPLGVGAILNLTAFASAGTPLVGQTFVIVELIRGLGGAAMVLGTLLQGYVSSTQRLSYPGSPIVSSTDGEPAVRTILGTLPAAGNDILETVPTGARWELLAVRTTLAIGGGGAALPTFLTFDDGAFVFAESQTLNAGGPGTLNLVSYGQGIHQQSAAIAGGVSIAATCPANRLPGGSRFQLHTDVGPANVTWGQPVYNVREWQEVA